MIRVGRHAQGVRWQRVERLNGSGVSYAYYERILPRVPDQLLDSVVYLFQDEDHARSGSSAGGTGLLVDFPSEGTGDRCCYVVSNIHVVRNGCTTVRINTPDGGATPFKIPAPWADHPDGDDVSIAPIDYETYRSWHVGALRWEDLCPTTERLEELNVGIGDDVCMLGRFVGHTGRQRNQPLARFGSIAMMPDEKVKDGRGLLVEAYLVEMRSLPGFSGSPVFIYIGPASNRGRREGEEGMTMIPFYTETIGLLGIDTGHKPLTNPVIDKDGKPVGPPRFVQQNSGVAIVAPYYKIREVLEGEELMEQRRQLDQDALADPERGTLDVAEGEAEDEYARFEDLTRKIVQVPKKELDEKRKED